MNNKLIKPLHIGSVVLKNNLILAPLAGYTDIAFRRLCRDAGAGLTITEMVSTRGLVRENKKTELLLQLAPNETPSCVQLFGSDPDDFVKSIESDALKNFDIIDINMGCPMPKVTKNSDGSALLDDPALASKIVEASAKTGRNITVKVRLGKTDNKNAVDFCKMIQDSGAKMVTVHGRTVKQLYSGTADWDTIGEIANALSIPVIGNGDISSVADANFRLANYGVAGIMIGRGAIGKADLFSFINGGEGMPVKQLMLKHIDYSLQYFSEFYTVCSMRKHIACYLKGLPDTKAIKDKANHTSSANELIELIQNANF